MKAIILAAGTGSRLEHLTEKQPKCLIRLWGESLLNRQLRQLRSLNIADVLVVAGYQHDQINELDCQLVINSEYENSNMVFSLSKALAWIQANQEHEFLVLYGDIAYSTSALRKLINAKADQPITVLGNLNWLDLWKLRMEDPYMDVESFEYDNDGLLTSIGQPPTKENTMAQFMGMYKATSSILHNSLEEYLSTANKPCQKNLYMTDYLDDLCNKQLVNVELVHGQWIEMDTLEDHALYTAHSHSFFGLD